MNTAASTTPAAPASGSTPSGKAGAAAAAAATASSPDGANSAEMPLTPGLEQLSEADIAAAFMGSKVVKPASKQKEDTDEETETDEEEEEESEEETEEAEEEESTEEESEESDEEENSEEEDTEAESDDEKSPLGKGLDKALKDHPGLRKRIKSLMAEHPKLKRENAALQAQLEERTSTPEQVMPATGDNLFADAVTEAAIEQKAAALAADARAKLRWLNRHPDGGTYGEGEQAVEISAEQVDRFIEHYEGVTDKLTTQKTARKDWLKGYQGVVKELGADKVVELTKPKTATRESALFKAVPELMRDPAFLQVLADAKEGRERREKTAKGVKFVEVNPGKKAPAAEGKKPAPKDSSKTAAVADKNPETKGGDGKAKPLTPAALNKLRSDADAGDKRAQDQLDRLFMA